MRKPHLFREGRKVWFYLAQPADDKAYLGRDCGDELNAEAVLQMFRREFDEVMTQERMKAYLLGRREGRKKARCRTILNWWLS